MEIRPSSLIDQNQGTLPWRGPRCAKALQLCRWMAILLAGFGDELAECVPPALPKTKLCRRRRLTAIPSTPRVMPRIHRAFHRSDRIGWLRAAVLGANDGIASTMPAKKVAEQLMAHDVLGARSRRARGLRDARRAADSICVCLSCELRRGRGLAAAGCRL